jgi:hypothetical protein
MNNVGKTAFLEAIYLLLGGQNIELILKIQSFRGRSLFQGDPTAIRDAVWAPLFFNFEMDRPFEIEGTVDNGAIVRSVFEFAQAPFVIRPASDTLGIEPTLGGLGHQLHLSHQSIDGSTFQATLTIGEKGFRIEPSATVPFLPGYFVSSRPLPTPIEDANLYSQLQAKEEPEEILAFLKLLEPRLKRMAVIISAGVPMLHGDVGLEKMIPLLYMGDGLRRMASILLTIANAPGGVVLIDDIELGIHHSHIHNVWRALAQAANRFNTQLILTTHSYEWITGAASVAQESFLEDIRLHRIERTNGKLRFVTYDKDTLLAATRSEIEVR